MFGRLNLPNSMARDLGTDRGQSLRELEVRWVRVTRAFHEPEGGAYLASRIDAESDELTQLAILRILHEAGRPEALQVFKKYAQHSSRVVSEWAMQYLAAAEAGGAS